MIIRARAPLRLSFGGGGTDVSPFCDDYGGCVLNGTIDKYAYANIELNEAQNVYFEAADLGLRLQYHPAEGDTGEPLALHKAVYRRIVNEFNGGRNIGLTLTTLSDAPPGSGLGSSSTLVVAMVKAFVELLNLPLGDYEIAHLAYEIERIDVGLMGGKQDQYAATFGGFNFMEFERDNHVLINPLRVKNWIISELESSILLYYTGKSRKSANIIEEQADNIRNRNETALAATLQLKEDAVRMKEALLRGDMRALTTAIGRSWEAKKRVAANISDGAINAAFEAAMTAGADAAKISGAGGGGFMMLFMDPTRRIAVINSLAGFDGYVTSCHFVKHGTQGWRIG